jgi:hypothetical protein
MRDSNPLPLSEINVGKKEVVAPNNKKTNKYCIFSMEMHFLYNIHHVLDPDSFSAAASRVFCVIKAIDDEAFFLARRNVSPMTLGMSLAATILGASAVLGTLGWGWVLRHSRFSLAAGRRSGTGTAVDTRSPPA